MINFYLSPLGRNIWVLNLVFCYLMVNLQNVGQNKYKAFQLFSLKRVWAILKSLRALV